MKLPKQFSNQSQYLAWLPQLVLLVLLLLTIATTIYIDRTTRLNNRLRFEQQIQQTQADIEARLDLYVSALRGVTSVFAVKPNLSREEFRVYVDRLDLPNTYPGVQGIGFSRRVKPEAREQVIDAMRSQGLTEFRIWPEGVRDEYHSIVYLEPLNQRNAPVLGFDMFSEPTRRAAMEQARDTGLPATSGRVILVQDQNSAQFPGFLIYVPVYEYGIVPATIEQRREQLLGFAYSPFRADVVFQNIFSNTQQSPIAFELYDGSRLEQDLLLYSASQNVTSGAYRPLLETTKSITISGRQWTIRFQTLPAFEGIGTQLLVPATLILGIIFSCILFGVLRTQTAARAQAEAAVRVRDIFLSIASHELKTPLTSLLGNTQMLQRRATHMNLEARDHRSINVILSQSQRLNRLIDTLLDHSRIQAGRFTIEQQDFDFTALVQRVVQEFEPTAHNHTFHVHTPEHPVTVFGDPVRLEQVVQNLLGNAVKYSPAGGPVAVELTADDQAITLRVSDHGLGIPADSLPHLFQQFYRASNISAQNISGMGIGLYLVREILSLHGGSISVESQLDHGSTFIVTLPLATEEAAVPQIAPAHNTAV